MPQFHPIPENDEWWGAGFTEWRNVVKARPRFRGHYQPHLPLDLGFYDLRLPEVQDTQADLARAHGIHGFVYYHYWFSGRRLLHRPLDTLLERKAPRFPFALCWANENWTRVWDGGDDEVLVAQAYSAEDDARHMEWLAPVLRDDRYIRVDGRPLLLVYRASALPDARRTTETWRRVAAKLGVDDLYLCRVEAFPADRIDPAALGFDASVRFQPDWLRMGEPIFQERWRRPARRLRLGPGASPNAGDLVYDYDRLVDLAITAPAAPYSQFPCVMPSWDNSPRRRRAARIVHGSTPEGYERWLRWAVTHSASADGDRLVFVNAWNEWGEGSHLEPDERWGHGYLEATRRAILGS